MAYDDIANHKKNPFPGMMFNHPDGNDVYAGVKIDYYGKDVTPENFLAVLTGDADAVTKTDERTTGKVLTSTSQDNVYIFFSDHGDDNIIAFPNKYLYADELFDAFKTMNMKRMYKELVFYLEACHSGSMFNKILPNNMSIYTTTAANPDESSYAEYCSYEAKVNGTLIGSCLGDEYSCRFMEDIDSRPGDQLKDYTMQEQYEYLVGAVKGSHVMQYGDLKIAQKSIYEFVNAQSKKVYNFFKKGLKYILPPSLKTPTKIKINNENYRLEWYKMQAELSNDAEAEAEYYEEIMAQGRVTKIFDIFNNKFGLSKRNYDDDVDFDCYRKVQKAYEKQCGTLIDRDFKFMTHMANFCTKGINPKKAARAFKAICE
jgi:legumain